MNEKSHDNIDHMHDVVQRLQRDLVHLLELARDEFGGGIGDLNGYNRTMVDAFAQTVMQASENLRAIHAMIDQDFEAITGEDLVEAFRKRLGREPGHPAGRGIPQEKYTVGEVPLSLLPDWGASTFDPDHPPTIVGRHRSTETEEENLDD